MKHRSNNKSGQTMVEYIIIVVIVAIAAIAIFGVFSDTIRAKLGGAVAELGGDSGAKDTALNTGSHDILKDLGKDGAGTGGGGGH
jgi:type IV pilus assembly protein PilA